MRTLRRPTQVSGALSDATLPTNSYSSPAAGLGSSGAAFCLVLIAVGSRLSESPVAAATFSGARQWRRHEHQGPPFSSSRRQRQRRLRRQCLRSGYKRRSDLGPDAAAHGSVHCLPFLRRYQCLGSGAACPDRAAMGLPRSFTSGARSLASRSRSSRQGGSCRLTRYPEIRDQQSPLRATCCFPRARPRHPRRRVGASRRGADPIPATRTRWVSIQWGWDLRGR